jgi:hypothetical protein
VQDQWKATAPRTGSASLSSGPPAATVLGANDAVPQMQPTAALSQPAPKVEKFDASKALAIAGMVIAEKEEQKAKEDAAAKDAEPEAPPTPEPVVLMQGPAAFLSPTMEEGEEESEEESEEDGDGGEELLLLMEEEEDATAGPRGSTAAAAAAAARTARASAFATSPPAPIAAAQESTAQPPPSDRAAAAAAEWDLVVEQREKTAAISTAQMLEAGMNPDRRGVKPKLGGWGNPISFVEAAERFIAAISAMPADQLPPIIPIGGGGLFSCCMSGGPPPEELEREVQLVRCGTDTIFRAPTHTDWRWPFCRSLRLQKRTTPLSKKTHLVVMPFQSWIAATTTR